MAAARFRSLLGGSAWTISWEPQVGLTRPPPREAEDLGGAVQDQTNSRDGARFFRVEIVRPDLDQ